MLRSVRHIACVAANRGQHTRAPRWALLAVVLAALVFLGNGPCLGGGHEGYANGVGILDNGVVVIDLGRDQYASADGGYSWQHLVIWESGELRWAPNVDEHWKDVVRWGEAEVETPRGRYAISAKEIKGLDALLDFSIVRIEGDAKKVVYSPPHLQDAADRRFRDRQHTSYGSASWDAPNNLVYHAPSDNIVAILGLEGVVVGDAEDNWRTLLAEIGEQAVDVSVQNKLSFVLDEVWPIAILAAISATAAALAFAYRERRQRAGNGNVSILTAAGFLSPLILIMLLIIYGVFLAWDDVFGDDTDHVFTFQIYAFNAIASALGAVAAWRKDHPWFRTTSLFASAAVPLIIVAAIAGFLDNRGSSLRYVLICVSSIIAVGGAFVIWSKVRALVGASSLLIACIISTLALITVHSGEQSFDFTNTSPPEALIFTIAIVFPFSLISLFSFATYFVRQLPAVFAALIGMAALIVLAFAIDAALVFYIWPAKAFSVILVLTITLVLFGYLHKRMPPPQRQ